MDDSHTKPGDEVLRYFKSDPEVGLDDDQIKRYQEKYGPNGECDFCSRFHKEFRKRSQHEKE